jgi:ubiquinone biosynthesis protein UbiJ
LLSHLALGPVNHVLRGESWALERLASFAGRTARIDVLPFSAVFIVRESGELAAAPAGIVPDVHIRLSPPAALRILAGDEAAYGEVRVEGDMELARALELVVRNVRWDVEEDLARVFGDVLAHRMAGFGRAALHVPARAAASFARNLGDYWLEERPLIARRADVREWLHEVDVLRDDVERLAQRIARL